MVRKLNGVNALVLLVDAIISGVCHALDSPDPGGLGHRGVDLFQGKFTLDSFFINIGYHVRWLDKGH